MMLDMISDNSINQDNKPAFESTSLKAKNMQDFIGNSFIISKIRTVLQDLQSSKTGASLLFHGASGSGKSTFAYQLIAEILASNPEINSSWESLASHDRQKLSNRVLNLLHPDLHVIDSASLDSKNIGIDLIRESLQFARYLPVESHYKVLLLDKADHLNANSANSILKVLEELPQNTYFIIIADNLGKVLPTIRSRCYKFRFLGLSPDEFTKILGMNADPLLYQLSQGSVARAKAMQENPELIESCHKFHQILQTERRERAKRTSEILDLITKLTKMNMGWDMIKAMILDFMATTIKATEDYRQQQKQLLYYEKTKKLLLETEIYNLDKISVSLNVII